MVETNGVLDVTRDLTLIPPARLGPFLAESRRMLGLTIPDVVDALSGIIGRRELRMLETGRLCPTEAQVRGLAGLLHLPLERVVPGRVRLIVDANQGQMVTGEVVATFVPHQSVNEVLIAYLSCMTICRGTRPGTYVAPRADDVEVLSIALDESAPWVKQRLLVLSRQERDRIRLRVRTISQQSSLPSLGIFVAFTQVGALILVDADAVSGMPFPLPSFSAAPMKGQPGDVAYDEPEPCPVVPIGLAIVRASRPTHLSPVE